MRLKNEVKLNKKDKKDKKIKKRSVPPASSKTDSNCTKEREVGIDFDIVADGGFAEETEPNEKLELLLKKISTQINEKQIKGKKEYASLWFR